MRFSTVTVTPLGEVPLVLGVAAAKAHLGVEHDQDDALIEGFSRAAQGAVEALTGQLLTPRRLRLAAWGWPALPEGLRLWREPVSAIVSVQHLDAAGAVVTLPGTAWRWSEEDGDSVWPAIGAAWPALAAGLGAAAVRVTFEAGYEEGLCPAPLSQAVSLLVGSYYANREEAVIGSISSELPAGVQFLCRPFRRVLI